MGEIRFVGKGETRGYPYLVCKKIVIFATKQLHHDLSACTGYESLTKAH